jgi:DNA-binding LacI/PurR family transcriptional regulator
MSTDVISLVVPELDSPYFSELASIVVRAGEKRGLVVHIDQTDGDPVRERRMLEGPVRGQVGGVIFSPWAMTPGEVSRRAVDVPMVMLGERSGLGEFDRVAVDNVAAAREATAHLLQQGRRHVAAIGLQPHLSNETARLRRFGYEQALREAGVARNERLEVRVRRLHRADGAEAMSELLARGVDCDAIFCFTDQLALGAMRTLAERGIRVPDDVAVVGFDDIEDGRYSVPSLSTISPDKQQIAELALDCLLEGTDGSDRPARDLVAAHRLVVRESSVTHHR